MKIIFDGTVEELAKAIEQFGVKASMDTDGVVKAMTDGIAAAICDMPVESQESPE